MKNLIKRLFQWAVIPLVLVLISLGIQAYLNPSVELALEQLDIAQVKRSDLVSLVRGTAVLEPAQEHWVIAEQSGIIKNILVQEGESVTKETVLMEIINDELSSQYQTAQLELLQAETDAKTQAAKHKMELSRAESELSMARLDHEANLELLKRQVASRIDVQKTGLKAEQLERNLALLQESQALYEQAEQFKIQQKKARVEELFSKLNALKVKAGANGKLIEFENEFKPGMSLQTGAVVGHIADDTELRAVLKIPSRSSQAVFEGQRVKLEGANEKTQGEISRILPSIKSNDLTVMVALPEDLPRVFKPGISLRGQIETERLEQVLQVRTPVSVREGDQKHLFKLEPGSRNISVISVTFGAYGQGFIEITAGVQAGDWLVLSDVSKWTDHNHIELDQAFMP